MPICKKCGDEFPNRMVIDGKERVFCKRKYCLSCSPFGKNNRKALEVVDALLVCKTCGRKYVYDRAKGHRLTKCNSCHVNIRRFRLKEKAIKYKGGKCSLCGYNKCSYSMHFHHVNGSKDFNIAGKHCYSWDKIKKELDKCVLVCANCHGEIHSGLHEEKRNE